MMIAEQKRFTIKKLLTIMVKKDSSDLYLTAGSAPAYRVSGSVLPLNQDPLTPVESEQLASSTMNEKQRAYFAEYMEMNLALSYPELGRFRVNIFRQRSCVGMVIRLIKTEIPSIEDLSLPDIFKDISMSKLGLVIMVGATSSGKSTSLAAMIDWRNRHQNGHIITIEDPVEFVHRHKKCIITQREVGTDTLDFKSALKNTLRQAPDVILVGEIRDRETMEHALELAETGHLCMATLHANNSNQALERVVNMFSEEMHAQVQLNLALNLRAILSQRLIKTPDGGRAAVIEILVNSPRISDLIIKGAITEIKEAMQEGSNYGMQTFDQHLFTLWKSGRITEDDALNYSDSENDIRLRIKMSKLSVDNEEEEEEEVIDDFDDMDNDSPLELQI
ncbi:MAG: PilT/PilU family type 4a pilus ATPase [Mariprofundaceae bacterium]|nr:PilT/PilU family type 4a pilus ATPase [Mariprofundaceae bacterium]